VARPVRDRDVSKIRLTEEGNKDKETYLFTPLLTSVTRSTSPNRPNLAQIAKESSSVTLGLIREDDSARL